MRINTKTLVSIILINVLITGFLFFGFYKVWVEPAKVLLEKQASPSFASNVELEWSGKLSKLFSESTKGPDFVGIAKEGIKGVVAVKSLVKKNINLNREVYEQNSGSGVIISSDGFIVTSNHVVEGASDLVVLLNDQREFKARLIGGDESTDIALLKIESNELPYLLFGDSDSLEVGEWVLAVGNPHKLQSTVTAGIVSAKGRNINILKNIGIESFIQTDAAVNSGNSGGALMNSSGLVIGINTAIISEGGGHEGFSFAIPVNLVRKVVNDIKEYGSVQRGWMGVELRNVDFEVAKELGLREVNGVLITLVIKGGAAYEAGLLTGDIIQQINGVKIKDMPQFMEKLGLYRPGDEVTVNFLRNDMAYSKKVMLKNQRNTTDIIAIRKDPVLVNLGLEIRNLDAVEKGKLNTNGVLVVSVMRNSIIGKTNLEPGFIITKYNNQKIESDNDLINMLKKYKGKVILEGFYENYPGEYPYTFDNNF
jgi:serine protease Do